MFKTKLTNLTQNWAKFYKPKEELPKRITYEKCPKCEKWTYSLWKCSGTSYYKCSECGFQI
jgi:predicted RNA-binding Zn-ribbon protein involved in translation (DUF1610 family)